MWIKMNTTLAILQCFLCVLHLGMTQTYQREIALQAPAPMRVPGRPALVDKNPIFTDNYLAASMQVMAYLTDLMKYDIPARPTSPVTQKPSSVKPMSSTFKPTTAKPTTQKPATSKPTTHKPATSKPTTQKPTTVPTISSTTENAPTSPHVPGIFAPGKQVNDITFNSLIESRESSESYLAENPRQILHQINNLDEDFDYNEFDINKFSKNYDDNFEILQRSPPLKPTSAYVVLLSLYDVYNKEAKALGLNRFSGYSTKILKEINENSNETALEQLKFVLTKTLEQDESKAESGIKKRTNRVLEDLEKQDGAVYKVLRYYPPMAFTE